jgi:riboflavin biosynthesis pyrimidine reductase
MMERRRLERGVDVVLCGSDAEDGNAAGAAARVLVSATGRVNAGGRLFRGRSPVIVYSTERMPGVTRAALARKAHVRVQLRADGGWALREVLEDLYATHGARRVGFAGGAEMFRALVAGGLLDELCLAWCPRVLGGKSVPAITGLEDDFLPRGVVLDLLKLERMDGECLASYRVRGNDEKFPKDPSIAHRHLHPDARAARGNL